MKRLIRHFIDCSVFPESASFGPNIIRVGQKIKIPGTAAPKKTNAEIAKEVIAGKWGNGTDRKKRLEAAGYDYNAVQRAVNAALAH